MSSIFQVGVGSGGMVVLDLLCRDPRIKRFVLVDADVYKSHNIHRHYFGEEAVGRLKVDLAEEWVKRFRPDLEVVTLPLDVMDSTQQEMIAGTLASCDLGICAVDGEPAKYHIDHLMRQAGKRWTMGEVLSGGIGGWVHLFQPQEACYGCVASHLKREVKTDNAPPPDYTNPGGVIEETTLPASKASISTIASLHAQITLGLIGGIEPDFTSCLFSLAKVDGVFPEGYRTFRFRIARSPECLICGAPEGPVGEDLDVALDQALARLGHE
jgi:molybdopterin/thiamine biosynthesis adenylyltransferase